MAHIICRYNEPFCSINSSAYIPRDIDNMYCTRYVAKSSCDHFKEPEKKINGVQVIGGECVYLKRVHKEFELTTKRYWLDDHEFSVGARGVNDSIDIRDIEYLSIDGRELIRRS
jgi:hypothetical protein